VPLLDVSDWLPPKRYDIIILPSKILSDANIGGFSKDSGVKPENRIPSVGAFEGVHCSILGALFREPPAI